MEIVKVIIFIGIGALFMGLGVLLDRLVTSRAEDERSRLAAMDILKKNGLQAHLYPQSSVPGLGVKDHDLSKACWTLTRRGYVITDTRGVLVGKVAEMAKASSGDSEATP